MALTEEEQQRINNIETTVKELDQLVRALAEELRTVKLTVDQDVQIQGNLVVRGTITGNLAAGSVGNAQIVAQAITADKIKAGEIGNSHLADNAVTSAKIADGNVSNAELGDNAVTSAKIADGNVGTAELANNAVTTAQIKPGAVGKDRLASEVQMFLRTYYTSIVDILNPDADNDWPLGFTLPSGTYNAQIAVSGATNVNNFDVTKVELKAGSNRVKFKVVGGSAGHARLNLLIQRQ